MDYTTKVMVACGLIHAVHTTVVNYDVLSSLRENAFHAIEYLSDASLVGIGFFFSIH